METAKSIESDILRDMSLQNSLTWMEHLEHHFEERADYFKFAMVWMSMNSYYSSTYSERHERERIQHLAKDSEDLYQNLRQNQMKDVIEDFRNVGWLHGVGGDRDCVSDERDSNKVANYSDGVDDAEHFFMVLYQIRCNFFHGDKSLHLEGNHRLLAWAYKYANIFWKAFLDQNQYTEAEETELQSEVDNDRDEEEILAEEDLQERRAHSDEVNEEAWTTDEEGWPYKDD